jgi:DNA-binding MarR family transcriptional regulator
MTICMEQEMKRTTDEALVLGLLARKGSATIEELMDLSRMSWEQVFGLIDRLSRSGSIRLTRVGTDYYVEKMGTA